MRPAVKMEAGCSGAKTSLLYGTAVKSPRGGGALRKKTGRPGWVKSSALPPRRSSPVVIQASRDVGAESASTEHSQRPAESGHA